MSRFVLIPGAGGGAWCWHRVAAGAQDRFFPAGFQRQVAQARLGIEADVIPGGHLNALSQPEALADYLLAAASEGTAA